jgi:hypothetical protein
MSKFLNPVRMMLMAMIVFLTACNTTLNLPAENNTAAADQWQISDTSTLSSYSLPVFEPVPAGRFDNGRMWTFEYAPVDYFRETYAFEPSTDWFEHARLGSVRLPNCSGSFVSASGLVMTNHHCAREQISQVSTGDENLLDNGFYAITLSDERRIEDYYVDQLIEIRDVTDRILAEIDAAPLESRAEVRQLAIERLEAQFSAEVASDESMVVQVVSLYNGGRYSAYFFRRYSDVRLVMAPELQIGYYGGDTDNFTYPRYNLDMTFYRVYENDAPLASDYFFPFSREGVQEGDAVFLIGNPGNTSRQQTVAQLTFRGLYGDKYYANFISRVILGLEGYYAADPVEAEAMDLRNFIFALKNAEKFYGGQVLALQDPHLMGRRVDNENSFRAKIGANPVLAGEYLPIIDRIAEIQLEKIAYAPMYFSSIGISPNARVSSAIEQRALYAFIYGYYTSMGVPAENLSGLRQQILNIRNKPAAQELEMLTQRLLLIEDILGSSHPVVALMQQSGSARDLAQAMIAGSPLAGAETTAAFLDTDFMNTPDLAFLIIKELGPQILEAQEAYRELMVEEDELLSQLGRAWFAVYGTSIPPDATFSLRISDGVVSSYNYNGTLAPAYTTFYGLYDRAHSHHTNPEFSLPARWQKPTTTMDLSTPVNFVSTNDIIGGNSGSPVVNVRLEIVGLAFDSNIEGMGASDFILDGEYSRTVSVDSRGMLEALRHVYKADRLVAEIINARR